MTNESGQLIGRIYDIQEFSVHDGPGVRTTVFLKGCPLRCPWCHSPESQLFEPQMSYTDLKCIGADLCGACLKACKAGALTVGEPEKTSDGKSEIRKIIWSRKNCLGCTACTKECFPEALSVCGKDYTVEEVTERLRKSYSYFESCEGGVTVSGGEPLSQIDFTEALLRSIKEEGIHTALDTTGFAPQSAVERVLPYVDLFLFDLKHMDSEKHNEIVKVPNERIHENARFIAAHGGKFQIRMPVIPTFNDDEENMVRTAEFCKELGDAVKTVQLLPFHHYGASKYARIQMYDPMPDDVVPPDDETMQQYLQLFLSYGLNTIIH